MDLLVLHSTALQVSPRKYKALPTRQAKAYFRKDWAQAKFTEAKTKRFECTKWRSVDKKKGEYMSNYLRVSAGSLELGIRELGVCGSFQDLRSKAKILEHHFKNH